MRSAPICTTLAVCVLLINAAFAQPPKPTPAVGIYDRDGLKFHYPADWTLVEKSTADMQHLILTKTGSMLLIVIVSPKDNLVERGQFALLHSSVYKNYFSALEETLKTKDKKPEREFRCSEQKGHTVGSTRLKGTYNGEASTGEIYSFGFFKRYLGLVYFKAEKESAIGDPVLNDLIKSINFEVGNSLEDLTVSKNYVEGGTLNRMAIWLPKPVYPLQARGTTTLIKVRVKINEKGEVVSAITGEGENGHLRRAAEGAARLARFSPTTICGGATKITGILLYNFVD